MLKVFSEIKNDYSDMLLFCGTQQTKSGRQEAQDTHLRATGTEVFGQEGVEKTS